MRRAAWVFIVAATLGVVAGLLAWVATIGGPRDAVDDSELASFGFQPHPGAQLPLTTPLVDEDGRAVTLGTFFGTPVIVVLDYLRCQSLCGVTLRNLLLDGLNGLPRKLGRDYQLVAISIDPRDKPSDAATARTKYLELLSGGGDLAGMHFLTAAPAAIRAIADTIGFPYRYDPQLDQFVHPAGFVVAGPDGVIARYIEGLEISPAVLDDALRGAQENKPRDLLTRILLFCHGQSPSIGRYTVPVLAAFTIANITAGIALIAIFATIGWRSYG